MEPLTASFELVFDDLAETAARLAMEVVSIQKVFDEAARSDLAAAAEVTQWPEPFRQFQPPIGRRLLVRNFSIDCALEVETTRQRSLTVAILGIGLGRLSQKRVENSSRLRLEVQTVSKKVRCQS